MTLVAKFAYHLESRSIEDGFFVCVVTETSAVNHIFAVDIFAV